MRNPRRQRSQVLKCGGLHPQAASHSINLRNTPEITFVLDQSIEYGVRMSKMIDDVTKDIPDRADEAGRGNRRMTNFDDFLAEAHTVAIGGHPSRW